MTKKSLKKNLEDIEFVADFYFPDLLVSDTDKPCKYKMSFRGNSSESVIVEFDPSYSEYVFTIDGKGPYSYDSYEYIQREIERALDYRLQKNEKDVEKQKYINQLYNVTSYNDVTSKFATDLIYKLRQTPYTGGDLFDELNISDIKYVMKETEEFIRNGLNESKSIGGYK